METIYKYGAMLADGFFFCLEHLIVLIIILILFCFCFIAMLAAAEAFVDYIFMPILKSIT